MNLLPFCGGSPFVSDGFPREHCIARHQQLYRSGQHLLHEFNAGNSHHRSGVTQLFHKGHSRKPYGRRQGEPTTHTNTERGRELGPPGHHGGSSSLAIFLISSLGNSAVVIVIIKHRQLRTVTNAFNMSLSLKDGVWMFGDRFCVANWFFNTCFGIISTLTMTLIYFDRYYAIVRQPHEKIGRRKAIQLLVAVWLTAVFFSLPWYMVMRTAKDLVTVRLSEIRVWPVTIYANLLRFYSEMRTATTVLIMIVFIIFCWGPYCLMGIITVVGDYSVNPVMDTLAIWMAWANGAINPLIYVIRNPNISLLLGRSRKEGYRTRNIPAYLSTQTQSRDVRTRADRIRDRYVSRHGVNRRLSSSSPANRGEVAMWACNNPALFFCRDAQPNRSTVSKLAVPKVETADTSL
ncbi:unnamed protein product [Coregonus sp. 'balchen']|nr:unnamed protein product [Coregonus sp. 'balchen']